MKYERKIKTVPHIEDIKGCYKYGGIWNKHHKICLDRVGNYNIYYDGCTAPIKGIKFCWGHTGNENYKIPYIDEVLADTNDIVFRYESASSSNDADAKYIASAVLSGYKKTNEVCCNPFGKIVDCKQRDAIITRNGSNIKEIADSYRKMRGHTTLVDFYKDWREAKPRSYNREPKRYDKVHQSKFVDLEDQGIWLEYNVPIGRAWRKLHEKN